MTVKFSSAVVFGSLILCTSPVFAQSLIHDYELNNTYADSLGGPSLVGLGGTIGANGYTFPADQGLSLSGAISLDNYSIQIAFEFDSLSGYRKIIDFENKGTDAGLYNLNSDLNFYPYVTSATSQFSAGVPVNLIVTRDATSGLFNAYINGAPVLSLDDSSVQQAVFNTPDNLINFFVDDNHTGGGESSSGNVSLIKIWDGPLGATDIANNTLPGSVPEPGTMALLGFGLTGLAGMKKFRRKS